MQGLVAASSHTAALATDAALWDAAIRQAGILQVDGIEALMDALLIFSAHGELRGSGLGIFGSGGGVSVTSSDAAARAVGRGDRGGGGGGRRAGARAGARRG